MKKSKNRLEAEKIHKKFNRKLSQTQIKIRNGDKQAAIDLIKIMTEENLALRKLRYMVSDEGKLIRFKPRYTKEEAKLRKLAREGDINAIKILLGQI